MVFNVSYDHRANHYGYIFVYFVSATEVLREESL